MSDPPIKGTIPKTGGHRGSVLTAVVVARYDDWYEMDLQAVGNWLI